MTKSKANQKEKTTIKKHRTIKFKLIVLPLVLVLIAIIIIGSATSYLTMQNLLEAKEASGIELIEQVVERIEDNSTAIATINGIMEDDMRIAASKIIKDRENLSNEYLDEIANTTSIDNIYYYAPDREMIYSTVRGDIGWIPDEDHSLTAFSNSSDEEIMEDIRQDTASEDGDYFKFGAIKMPDGAFLQFAINANTVNELTDQYSYQHLMDELAESPSTEYAGFANPDALVIAHSDNERIDNYVPKENIANYIKNKEKLL